ncbi:Oidioi.mRNA.OKI2018_I69.chr1.g3271.t1.cds [Oikopleura dioica]|uniref:Oidioi.mRNA.OKI2018_I69.chr1.g3271.t1.cds n=1 Tax=Oikopleura dioica TaxID=34765 RepID=A0ABN7STL6_OIKDI|nr:Oidioi.mRNA.OKI2018_I69.chr1.g3271.t1.cds [Oikopleura dioica]
MAANKSLLETVTEIRSINDRVNYLEEQVRNDESLKPSLEPLITESRVKLEQLSTTLLTCELDQGKDSTNATMREEAWVATTWSRHVQDLPKLDAACNTSFNTFLGRADIYHRAYVRDRPSREQPFIAAVYSHFDLNIERSLGTEFLNCQDWKSAKALLEKSFAAKSHYLLKLSEVFDVEYDHSKPFAHYTANVLQKMNEAKQATLNSYRQEKSADAGVDEIFDIFSTMMLYLNLRKEEPDVFNAILPSLSKVYDINELCRLAQSTRQNRVDSATVSQHFNRNKNKRRRMLSAPATILRMGKTINNQNPRR